MTAVLCLLIVLLTCMFAVALWYVDRLRRDGVQRLASEQERGDKLSAELRDTMRAQVEWLMKVGRERAMDNEMHQNAARELQRQWFEQLQQTTKTQAETLNSAVRVAFQPVPDTPQSQAGTPYQMPVPFYAQEGGQDAAEWDPTDAYVMDTPTGRVHVDAVIADDSDLYRDGKWLGVEGLQPPAGMFEMLGYQPAPQPRASFPPPMPRAPLVGAR